MDNNVEMGTSIVSIKKEIQRNVIEDMINNIDSSDSDN
jgi:hypothetical protein